MDLSLSMNYLQKQRNTPEKRSLEDAARLASEAGFRYADYTPEFTCENCADAACRDRETLSRYGIRVEQTHAPFNRYRTYPDHAFQTYYRNLFEASAAVGAKYVVVHADEYRTKDRYCTIIITARICI